MGEMSDEWDGQGGSQKIRRHKPSKIRDYSEGSAPAKKSASWHKDKITKTSIPELSEEVIAGPDVYAPPVGLTTFMADAIGDDLYGQQCLDLGTGTGALGFIMLKRNAAAVVFADIKSQALDSARQNAARLGYAPGKDPRAEFVHSDLFSDLPGRKFNLILFTPSPMDGWDVSANENQRYRYREHVELFFKDAGSHLDASSRILFRDTVFPEDPKSVDRADQIEKMVRAFGEREGCVVEKIGPHRRFVESVAWRKKGKGAVLRVPEETYIYVITKNVASESEAEKIVAPRPAREGETPKKGPLEPGSGTRVNFKSSPEEMGEPPQRAIPGQSPITAVDEKYLVWTRGLREKVYSPRYLVLWFRFFDTLFAQAQYPQFYSGYDKQFIEWPMMGGDEKMEGAIEDLLHYLKDNGIDAIGGQRINYFLQWPSKKDNIKVQTLVLKWAASVLPASDFRMLTLVFRIRQIFNRFNAGSDHVLKKREFHIYFRSNPNTITVNFTHCYPGMMPTDEELTAINALEQDYKIKIDVQQPRRQWITITSQASSQEWEMAEPANMHEDTGDILNWLMMQYQMRAAAFSFLRSDIADLLYKGDSSNVMESIKKMAYINSTILDFLSRGMNAFNVTAWSEFRQRILAKRKEFVESGVHSDGALWREFEESWLDFIETFDRFKPGDVPSLTETLAAGPVTASTTEALVEQGVPLQNILENQAKEPFWKNLALEQAFVRFMHSPLARVNKERKQALVDTIEKYEGTAVKMVSRASRIEGILPGMSPKLRRVTHFDIIRLSDNKLLYRISKEKSVKVVKHFDSEDIVDTFIQVDDSGLIGRYIFIRKTRQNQSYYSQGLKMFKGDERYTHVQHIREEDYLRYFSNPDLVVSRELGSELRRFNAVLNTINRKRSALMAHSHFPWACGLSAKIIQETLFRYGFKSALREQHNNPETGAIQNYVSVDVAGTNFIVDINADTSEWQLVDKINNVCEMLDVGVVVLPRWYLKANYSKYRGTYSERSLNLVEMLSFGKHGAITLPDGTIIPANDNTVSLPAALGGAENPAGDPHYKTLPAPEPGSPEEALKQQVGLPGIGTPSRHSLRFRQSDDVGEPHGNSVPQNGPSPSSLSSLVETVIATKIPPSGIKNIVFNGKSITASKAAEEIGKLADFIKIINMRVEDKCLLIGTADWKASHVDIKKPGKGGRTFSGQIAIANKCIGLPPCPEGQMNDVRTRDDYIRIARALIENGFNGSIEFETGAERDEDQILFRVASRPRSILELALLPLSSEGASLTPQAAPGATTIGEADKHVAFSEVVLEASKFDATTVNLLKKRRKNKEDWMVLLKGKSLL
ncbi:MAG: methyltransferase [Candidatus Omnitrophica bacterium]|nr:methyltransferase [Candidatus Omnitrophota bacterium]